MLERGVLVAYEITEVALGKIFPPAKIHSDEVLTIGPLDGALLNNMPVSTSVGSVEALVEVL